MLSPSRPVAFEVQAARLTQYEPGNTNPKKKLPRPCKGRRFSHWLMRGLSAPVKRDPISRVPFVSKHPAEPGSCHGLLGFGFRAGRSVWLFLVEQQHAARHQTPNTTPWGLMHGSVVAASAWPKQASPSDNEKQPLTSARACTGHPWPVKPAAQCEPLNAARLRLTYSTPWLSRFRCSRLCVSLAFGLVVRCKSVVLCKLARSVELNGNVCCHAQNRPG